MVTPMYRFDRIAWVCTTHAKYHVPFLCLGDHGPYCRIEYGEE
jgi:hypothetical protein